MKKLALLFLIIGAFFAYGLKYSIEKVKVEPNIDLELKRVATKEYLNSHIKEAINSKNIEDAKIYINLAKYLNVPIDKELLKEYQQETKPINSAIRNVKDFASGFISGKAKNGASLSGAIVCDFTIVGDVRDIYKEGSRYIAGESYNKFILGISLVGVALTASEIASFGATAPLKAGESIVKVAYKSGKLTKGFTKLLEKKLEKSIDFKLLKKVDFSSFKTTKNSINAVVKSINPKPFKQLFNNLNTIRKNSSTIDTIKLLKYVDNEKDLQKLIKLSKKYKTNTVGVLKILDKRALRGAKIVTKYGTKFILNIIGLLLSIFGFLISLAFAKRIRNTFL